MAHHGRELTHTLELLRFNADGACEGGSWPTPSQRVASVNHPGYPGIRGDEKTPAEPHF